jgi:hypothetical protein
MSGGITQFQELAEDRTQESLTSMAIDPEAFDFRIDMACVMKLSKSDPLSGAYSSLRAFAFPKGFTALLSTGIYVVNGDSGKWPVALQLPLLVSFKDEGCMDELAISWDLGKNGKLYLTTVPMPLEVDKKWRNDGADASIVRLEMVSKLSIVKNQDGNRIARQVNTWLEEHATRFRNLKLKSMKEIEHWCSKDRFSSNFKLVCRTSLLLALQAVKNDAGRKSLEKSKGREDGRNDESAKAQGLKDEFEVMARSIESCAFVYDLALQERILVAKLPPIADATADAPLSDEVLNSIIAHCPADHRDHMERLLRKRAVSSLLQSGTASSVHGGTPLTRKAVSVTAADEPQAEQPAADEPVRASTPLQSVPENAEVEEISSGDERAFVDAAAADGDGAQQGHSTHPRKRIIPDDSDSGDEDDDLFRDPGDVNELPKKRATKPTNHFEPEANFPKAAGKKPAAKKGRGPDGGKLQYAMSGRYAKSRKPNTNVPPFVGAIPIGTFSHNPQSNIFFSQSTSSNTTTQNHTSVKDITEVAQLRVDLREAQHKLALVEQKLELMQESHKVELTSKETAVRMEMMDMIEKAFQKGYDQCSAAMQEAKKLFGN